LPIHFNEIAFEEQYLVRKLVNQSEFEEIWSLYALENKTPNVNFTEKDVYFIGGHESGSCPFKIKNIKRNSENKTIHVPLSEPNGACTSDATPRTFVIQIDKKKSKDIESVVIVQNGVETSVPLKN
jgi:hypothetical protein